MHPAKSNDRQGRCTTRCSALDEYCDPTRQVCSRAQRDCRVKKNVMVYPRVAVFLKNGAYRLQRRSLCGRTARVDYEGYRAAYAAQVSQRRS